MKLLVVTAASRVEAVLEIRAKSALLGSDPGADLVIPGAGAPGERLQLTAYGSSLEVRSGGPESLEVAGQASRRVTLRTGESLRWAGRELHFTILESREGASSREPHEKWLQALFLLVRNCHTPVDPGQLLEGIMDCVMALSGADRGFLLLTGEGGDLSQLVTRRIDPADSDRFSRTIADEVLTNRKPVLIADALSDPRLASARSISDQGVRSIMAAPLLDGDGATGVIYLDHRARLRTFAPQDLELLVAAAEHAATALRNARQRRLLEEKSARLEAVVEVEVRERHGPAGIVFTSEPMKRLMEDVGKVSIQDTSVLVLGESGTGKELLARAIHDLSPRRKGPFVAVHCMALSSELLESELFGHEKGAFTGAADRRLGRFELASGGTIFLDEIGELDPRVQVKLLRVLQEKVIERVGGARPTPIDIRLVCATHVDLEEKMRRGQFREDLWYRIAVFPLRVPALRERPADVPVLVDHFLRFFRERMGKSIRGIEAAALTALERYRWPGNVRELRNLIERAFVLESGELLRAASFPFGAPAASPEAPQGGTPAPAAALPPGGSLKAAREAFERAYILEALRRHDNNVSRAAKELEVPRSSIYRRLDGAAS